MSLWSVSKLSSATESEKAMPLSFPYSYIPTVTKIIIDINSGNKLLDHQLRASPRAGEASKITQYHDCILKGKYIKSRYQLTKRLLTRQRQASVLYELLQAPRISLLFRSSQTLRHHFCFWNTPVFFFLDCFCYSRTSQSLCPLLYVQQSSLHI